jgi:hypothetical protein
LQQKSIALARLTVQAEQIAAGFSVFLLHPPTARPWVVFFCHTFCTHRSIVNSTSFVPKPVHCQSPPTAKRRFTPTASTVSLVPEKNNTQRYLNIMRSYLNAYSSGFLYCVRRHISRHYVK